MASALSLPRETRVMEGEGSEPGGIRLHLGHSDCCAEDRHNWERKGGEQAGWLEDYSDGRERPKRRTGEAMG